jgi:ABC-type Fe3+/spermidine/putrescine transport system ATPase subunit
MPEIIMEKVSKAYGDISALQDVSLTIKAGEYITIIGPSGCGKTTLIKTIAGIVKPDNGSIYVDGKLSTNLQIEDRNIGYVFQEIALFPHMNSYDNVSYGLMVKGVKPVDRRGPVEEMLYMMGLEKNVFLYPRELSGGARQKTAISRALISGSILLLLDEPLGSLDVKIRSSLRHELRKLVKDMGLTAIHVTHDQEEALSISDRIVVMKAGKIVEVGSPQDLYMKPKELFSAKFLGETNLLTGIVEKITYQVVDVTLNDSTVNVEVRDEGFFKEGEQCVLAIRPEFIELSRKPTQGNVLECVVESTSFMGDYYRIELGTSNGEVFLSKAATSVESTRFEVGEKVYINLPPKRVQLYKYPEEGLEKAISLE